MLSQDEARTILLKHARHPLRQGHVDSLSAFGECKNPLCGDHVRVEISVAHADTGTPDDVVEAVRILTQGCAISTASASLMTEMVEGQSRSDLLSLITSVHEAFLQKENAEWPPALATLEPLQHLRVTPVKVPCALIGWTALKSALIGAR